MRCPWCRTELRYVRQIAGRHFCSEEHRDLYLDRMVQSAVQRLARSGERLRRATRAPAEGGFCLPKCAVPVRVPSPLKTSSPPVACKFASEVAHPIRYRKEARSKSLRFAGRFAYRPRTLQAKEMLRTSALGAQAEGFPVRATLASEWYSQQTLLRHADLIGWNQRDSEIVHTAIPIPRRLPPDVPAIEAVTLLSWPSHPRSTARLGSSCLPLAPLDMRVRKRAAEPLVLKCTCDPLAFASAPVLPRVAVNRVARALTVAVAGFPLRVHPSVPPGQTDRFEPETRTPAVRVTSLRTATSEVRALSATGLQELALAPVRSVIAGISAGSQPMHGPEEWICVAPKWATLRPASAAVAVLLAELQRIRYEGVPQDRTIPLRARLELAVQGALPLLPAFRPQLSSLDDFRQPAPVATLWNRIPARAIGLLMAAPLAMVLATQMVSAPNTSSYGAGSLAGRAWSNVVASLSSRAAIDVDEDFRAGLSDWAGLDGRAAGWRVNEGSLIPGAFAVYRPSTTLQDYHIEFSGQVGKKALGWAVRAADPRNYYAVKVVTGGTGPLQKAIVQRYPVIEGVRGEKIERLLPFQVSPDTIYHVAMDVSGDSTVLSIQGQVVDSWSLSAHQRGGVGFFSEKGEQARIQGLRINHQTDAVGRLCAWLIR